MSRHKISTDDFDKEQMDNFNNAARMYENGEIGLLKGANVVGISHPTLRRLFAERGITIRGKGRPKNLNSVPAKIVKKPKIDVALAKKMNKTTKNYRKVAEKMNVSYEDLRTAIADN